MKLSVLVDNNSLGGFESEHGLSFWIECDNKKILFDTGQTNNFILNANKLNINIEERDAIILSHGHYDHGNGLQYLSGGNLITHPSSFISRYRRGEKIDIGLALSKNEIVKTFKINSSAQPVKITENLIYLGEIPRRNSFESKETYFIKSNGEKDFVIDDSALVAVKNKELFIIAGCSHSGIINIINYAMEVTGIKKIKSVIGGFHLKKVNAIAKKTSEELNKLKINSLYPTHCTSQEVINYLKNTLLVKELKAGSILHF